MLEHVVHQQAVALQLVDEDALLVHGTGAVGVAVEQQAQVVAALADACQRLVDVWPDGLGIDAAEPGVALAVQLVDDDPATGQQAADPAGARAVQRVDQHAHVGSLEGLEVERATHEGLVADVRVEALDIARRLGLVEGTPWWRLVGTGGDDRLDRVQEGGVGRGAASAT